MIRIAQLKLDPNHTKQDLKEKIRRRLRLKEEAEFTYEIRRQSVDAHHRPAIYLVYTVDVKIRQEEQILRRLKKDPDISAANPVSWRFPIQHQGSAAAENRPVIAGSGPAGLFAALVLSENGFSPIVIERGAPMEERQKDVLTFWKEGTLNPESNVQFGEGGAGTFSDGKLNTGVKDPAGRIRYILEQFVSCGAPEEILWSYKPHIGTDVLSQTVVRLRRRIIEAGGEFLFHTRLDDIQKHPDGGWNLKLTNTSCEKETVSQMHARAVILAVGHSARDTFRMLYDHGFPMHAKEFAVGVRVQHPQKMINDALYGENAPSSLGPAPYRLTARSSDGRGIYTFCMCPGGYVVNASSEQGLLAVNGMSYHDRAGANANSAVIVSVGPQDFGGDDPMLAVRFQRELEKKAFEAGHGSIPVQRLEDFRLCRESEAFGSIHPEIKGSYRMCSVREVFPEAVSSALEEGMNVFDRKIPGFAGDDVLLCAAESRTSSPVRIERNEQHCIPDAPGLYPCGEGAGYAGGITSAALDGLRVAESCAAYLNTLGIDSLEE